MKTFLAGIYTGSFGESGQIFMRLTEPEKACRLSVEYFLESYHYIHRQRYVDIIRSEGKKVFLDSGAFSAFTKGVDVDIDGYCDYIKRNQDIIDVASVLDGIGDPQKTLDNQMYMESQGVRPLPCFHYGEDERYLEYYINNYEYITLGGMVPISTKQLEMWLDRIWDKYLTDDTGRAKLKVHGFGLTVTSLMARYPWYSVDSSSWVQIAAMGNVYLPGSKVVPVSSTSPARRQENQHYDSLAPEHQKAIRDILEKKGVTIERLQDYYESRWAYNCYSFSALSEETDFETKLFHRPQPGLFDA
ncbi:MAG: hypothetical protein KAV87_32860 [Desulfobacteraceae bacterium]|nr:hypothetical protein [Desulfobacteraceae bacterium]